METAIPLAQPCFDGKELEYVTDCVKSGWVSSRGKYIERFEADFAVPDGYTAFTCSSGTAALHLALLAEGIGPGDEVIVPNLTFAATASVVKHVGATPVLVDVKEDGTIDPVAARRAVTARTGAVIPVHLYGHKAVIPDYCAPCIIEDCCEAVDVAVSTNYACYSFYANKHMTTGEGGMIVSRNAALVKRYRDSSSVDYFHLVPGLNYRMTNMQAALGCAQYERLPRLLHERHRVINEYQKRLKGFGRWVFNVKVSDPIGLRKHLQTHGIESRRIFWPLNEQPPFKQDGDFPISRMLHGSHLTLPTFPGLTLEQIERVCRAVIEFSSASMKDSRSATRFFSTPSSSGAETPPP